MSNNGVNPTPEYHVRMPQNDPASVQSQYRELPGVPVTPRAKRNNAVIGLVVLVVVLAIALALALIRPWEKEEDSGEGTSVTQSATAEPNSSPSVTAEPTGSPEDIAIAGAEDAVAKEKGWNAANADYIPSQPEAGRKLIATATAYDGESGRTLGNPSAPVVVHVFSDFSCPMCAKLHNESMEELESLARQGDIYLVWHNYAIFADEYGSDKPARGALAAAKQGKMWEYIDAVSLNIATPNGHAAYTDENVRGEAEKLGLDMARWDADYASDEVAQELADERTLASQQLGLSSTPTLLIGDAYVPGAYPLETLKNTIEMQTLIKK